MHCLTCPKRQLFYKPWMCEQIFKSKSDEGFRSRDFQVSCYINTAHEKRKRLGLAISAKPSIKLDFFQPTETCRFDNDPCLFFIEEMQQNILPCGETGIGGTIACYFLLREQSWAFQSRDGSAIPADSLCLTSLCWMVDLNAKDTFLQCFWHRKSRTEYHFLPLWTY